MLENNVLQVSYDLADTLLQRGLVVGSVEGTLLDAVASASRPVVGLELYRSVEVEHGSAVSILSTSSLEKEPNGEFRHGVVLEAALKQLAAGVRVDHDFARNGVNPIIRKIVEAVTAKEALRSDATELRPTIAPYFYSDVWTSASWTALVERFAEQPLVKINVKAPIELSEEIRPVELLLEGASKFGFAEDIKSLIANKGEEWVYSVFAGAFRNERFELGRIGLEIREDSDGWLFGNSRMAVDAVIVIHLMARSLLTKTPTGGYQKSDWDSVLSSVIGASGQRLYRAMQQRAEDRRRKVLVFTYGYTDGEYSGNGVHGAVVVNGDLYNDYLEKGGSPEALMGASYQSQLRNLDELLAANDALLANYQKHETLCCCCCFGMRCLRPAIILVGGFCPNRSR